MEDITKTTPHFIGNNIGLLIDKKALAKNDLESKAQTKEDLHKIIPKNRLSGLINGSYMLSLREAVIIARYFECSIEEVLRFEQ
jgi:plasmid maintenance system antidote protein VapI